MDAAQLPGVRMVTRTVALDSALARRVASSVVDPEIPILTIDELGILRRVSLVEGRVVVTITPTYSGCPALRRIDDDLRSALYDAGFAEVEVQVEHHPAWSTEWMSPEAREKLEAFGIAPPVPEDRVLCPRCASSQPRLIARFGSTACKALMVCSACGEPFDWFKEF